MIWPEEISFEGLFDKYDEWFNSEPKPFLGDPPIDAQYALDLIFKILVDDKEHYEYVTTLIESQEQMNSIMLDVILRKYAKRRYNKAVKQRKKKHGKL